MGRLYIETAQYNKAGTRTAKNVSTISATVSNVGTGALVQTIAQGSVTNDAVGRYYVSPTRSLITNNSVYNITWKVGFTGASVITDRRRFTFDNAGAACATIGRVKIMIRDTRIKLLVRGV